MKALRWDGLDDAGHRSCLARPALRDDATLKDNVQAIVDRVRAGGDHALLELTAEFDGADLTRLDVDECEFAAAEAALSDAASRAIDLAIENVSAFHERQRPAEIDIETMPGVRCQRISQPLQAVGLYVPAGSAPLPSTAIMLAVPAAIAGCERRIVCTPPRTDGSADPTVLAVARRTGITEVFKIGGAQAIAAMAYGTGSLPRVAKIFGPGNAYVTAAKTLVAQDAAGAAIDMPAGPSEVLVIADASAEPSFVASDLLSQAEHGEDSQVILVSTDESLATAVIQELYVRLDRLERRAVATASLEHARLIIASDAQEAVAISNRYAPEHLIIHTQDARDLLASVRNAGSVFLGPWSPESVGDYASGTNHVLPTYGAARSYSGLSVEQFMRHMTVQEVTRDGLAAIGDAVITLAGLEGLDAHAEAVRCRLTREPGVAS